MKIAVTAALATFLVAGAAQAQSINIGPGGVQVDPRTQRERAVDRQIQREERWRERERDRRRDWRANRRGSDCRMVTTREETRRGVVTRETRVCD